MTIPSPVYDPPFNITRASHVVLTVRDLAASRRFYAEVIGLAVSAEEGDALYLRGLEEACHHSLVLKRTSGQPVWSGSASEYSLKTISPRLTPITRRPDYRRLLSTCRTRGEPYM